MMHIILGPLHLMKVHTIIIYIHMHHAVLYKVPNAGNMNLNHCQMGCTTDAIIDSADYELPKISHQSISLMNIIGEGA